MAKVRKINERRTALSLFSTGEIRRELEARLAAQIEVLQKERAECEEAIARIDRQIGELSGMRVTVRAPQARARRRRRGRAISPRMRKLLARIAETLGKAKGAMSVNELAKAAGARVARVRLAVRRLLADGTVKRTGAGRGTRYAAT